MHKVVYTTFFLCYNMNEKSDKMPEDKTKTYSEPLIAKAKRLNIQKELKEKVIAMLEYLLEGKKLYLNKEFQSEYYLQISDSKLYQVARNYDSNGTPMQKRIAIMLVEYLPETYLQYQDAIEESISKSRRL